METSIVNYKCPGCSAALSFGAGSGMLECEHCGGKYQAEYLEALCHAAEEHGVEGAWSDAEWDMSGLQNDWQEDGLKSYSCPSCGAAIICHESAAATACPYCGNNAIIEGQFAGELRPDYIVPFALDREDAAAALQNYLKDRTFLPKKFREAAKPEKIRGVYLPFWLFDGIAAGRFEYDAVKVIQKSNYRYDVEIRRHYNIRRSGNMKFEKVPVLASSRVPAEYVDSIEPYNYKELRKFSTGYLPGFMADRYNVGVEDCKETAYMRCRQSLSLEMEESLSKYDEISPVSSDISVRPGEVHYALMPLWLLTVKWMGKRWYYAVNGQTGKTAGRVPMSFARIAGLFAAVCGTLGGLGSLLSWLFTQLPLN